MTNPTDHDLNLMLARVVDIAVEKGKHNDDDVWFVVDDYPEYGWDEYTVWSPLHDANQIERVEEVLCGHNMHFVHVWEGEHHHWDLMPQQPSRTIYRACDKDKKRALALAVYAMEQSQKGTT